MSNRIKKLGADTSYKRPAITQQEQYTAADISEKLAGYEEVDNIEDVPINTHIRYFNINKEGERLFRSGGFLSNKDNADTYVVLSNGKFKWSVQVADAIFYKKLSSKEQVEETKRKCIQKLEEKDYIIKKLKHYIKKKLNEEYDISTLLKQYKATIEQTKNTQNIPQTNIVLLKNNTENVEKPVNKSVKKSVNKSVKKSTSKVNKKTTKKPAKKVTKTSVKKTAKK